MKLKELQQKDFKMKLISDLGMKTSRGSSLRKVRFALFECSQCGKHFETSVSGVKANDQNKCKSCSQKTHGLSKSNLYQRYQNMLSRCYNKNSDRYSSYGALGVTVCEEWRDSFKKFEEWALTNGYKKHLELDKDIGSKRLGIYPPKYSPETCSFISSEENYKHRKTLSLSNSSGYKGVTKHKNKYKATIMVEEKHIHLGLWTTAIEAAKAYDFYIQSKRLDRISNDLLEQGEQIDLNLSHDRNKSGYHGVYIKGSKFAASCNILKGIKKYLGTFTTAEEAHTCRLKYITEHGLENLNKITKETKC